MRASHRSDCGAGVRRVRHGGREERREDRRQEAHREVAAGPTTRHRSPSSFTDKGKLTLSIDVGGKAEKIEGTYKLDGDKLEMVMSFGGKEMKETVTIHQADRRRNGWQGLEG